MKRLPFWRPTKGHPAIYDSETATCIEMVAKLYGSMDSLIEEYNTFASNVNKIIEEFIASQTKDFEVFKSAIRQEFQDFIDIINLKVMQQDNKINKAVEFMEDNLIQTVEEQIIAMVESNVLTLKLEYVEEDEELLFTLADGEIKVTDDDNGNVEVSY